MRPAAPTSLTIALLLTAPSCRDAAEAVDVDVDRAEQLARQTSEKVASGLDEARAKVEAVGGDLRDAADEVERSVSAPPAPGVDVGAELQRQAAAAIHCEAAAPGATPERCTVARAYADQLRQNPGFLATQSRVEPLARDGRPVGVQISGLQSVPKLLGFRERDVIVSINGLAVHSLQSAPQLFLQLRAARRFTVVYERESARATVVVDVV